MTKRQAHQNFPRGSPARHEGSARGGKVRVVCAREGAVLNAPRQRRYFTASCRALITSGTGAVLRRARLTRRPTRYSAGGRSRDPRGWSLPIARLSGLDHSPRAHLYRATSGAAPQPHDVRSVLGTASLVGAGMGGVYGRFWRRG